MAWGASLGFGFRPYWQPEWKQINRDQRRMRRLDRRREQQIKRNSQKLQSL